MITNDDKKLEELYTESVMEEGILDRLSARKAGFKHSALGLMNKTASKINRKFGGRGSDEYADQFDDAANSSKLDAMEAKVLSLMQNYIPKIERLVSSYERDMRLLKLDELPRGLSNKPEFAKLRNAYGRLKGARNSLIEIKNIIENGESPVQEPSPEEIDPDYPYYKNYNGDSTEGEL